MEAVETGKVEASKDVKALMKHVRKCFETEDIYVDQQRLMSRVQQLSDVIAQQKSFREQLESMRQQGGEPKPPVPTPKPEPEEKKLTNQLAKLFQNM